MEVAQKEMEHAQVRGVFIDVASADPGDIVDLRKNLRLKEVPIFILANSSEVPLAIEYVKRGAQGFLVKGLSDSDSVLKLMQYATSQH
jgi:FixJ family two-component response regulator